MKKILLAESEQGACDKVAGYLRGAGYEIIEATSSDECLRLCDWQKPDVAIIGDSLHDLDWLTLTARLRAMQPQLGIILIASRNDDLDHVSSLDAGADNYFPNTLHPHVVLAAVRNAVRRAQRQEHKPLFEMRLGHYRVNLLTRRISDAEGREVTLTPGEYALLTGLIRQRGEPVSRGELFANLRPVGDSCELGDLRTIDVLIGRLRRKLDRNPNRPLLIQTVYGKGYRLAGENELDTAWPAPGKLNR